MPLVAPVAAIGIALLIGLFAINVLADWGFTKFLARFAEATVIEVTEVKPAGSLPAEPTGGGNTAKLKYLMELSDSMAVYSYSIKVAPPNERIVKFLRSNHPVQVGQSLTVKYPPWSPSSIEVVDRSESRESADFYALLGMLGFSFVFGAFGYWAIRLNLKRQRERARGLFER